MQRSAGVSAAKRLNRNDESNLGSPSAYAAIARTQKDVWRHDRQQLWTPFCHVERSAGLKTGVMLVVLGNSRCGYRLGKVRSRAERNGAEQWPERQPLRMPLHGITSGEAWLICW